MDYNALGLANDISDNHKQSYVNVKDQEVLRAVWKSITL